MSSLSCWPMTNWMLQQIPTPYVVMFSFLWCSVDVLINWHGLQRPQLVTNPAFACPKLGARSSSVASPEIWNSLTPALHYCNCLDTFCWHLKLIASSKPFHFPRYFSPCASDLAFADIVHVYKFYLLTYRNDVAGLCRGIVWQLCIHSYCWAVTL